MGSITLTKAKGIWQTLPVPLRGAATLLAVLALAALLTTVRHNASAYLTGVWDTGSQTLVYGRIHQMEQGQHAPGGFLGVYTDDWSDDTNRALFRDDTPTDAAAFHPYTHQSGLQGWLFGGVNRLLRHWLPDGLARETALYWLNSTLFYAAELLAALAVWEEFGPLAAAFGFASVLLAPWLQRGMKDLYWCLWTWLLPLLAAAVLSSASCSDDKEKEPPVRAVNYTIEFSTVSQAVYLGDKYQTGEGNYRLTLTNADGDVLEADLTSVKAPKPSAAMPEAGVYTAAETRRAGTFAPEASSWETVKSGVEVRSANQAGQKTKFAIRAGSMTLAPAASGDGTFTLSGEVTDGDKTALAFSWSGALAFANESGEEDPVVYERLSMVFGDYYPNDYGIAADTYMLRGGNERVELHSQLRSVPAANPAAPLPSDGKYTIDLRSEAGKYANETFTFRSGYISQSGRAAGTYWKTDEATYVATSGSFTVSTVGESWKIEGTLRDDGAEETFSFTYTGKPGFKN